MATTTPTVSSFHRRITDWSFPGRTNSTTYAYDDAGRMTTATLPSSTDIVSTYAYDDADRLTGITHVKGGSTILPRKDSVAYALDDVGNRTQSFPGRMDQQGTHSYSYDDLYRLSSVTYPGPTTTSYGFDAFGNRTSMTVAGDTTTYAYDDNDRITSVTPPSPASVINYTWDDPSGKDDLTARGSDSFSWDYEDRMVSATVNSVTTNLTYRGDGLRDSRAVSGGATTTFTWDIASGLPVVLDDGNQYLYGAGLTAQKQSGNWYYYLADGLGSTMAVVNASGTVQDSYTYDVYGTPTKTGSLSNEFDFAGQQTDGTGLQYLRARYMDPTTGTFLSREPMALRIGWVGVAGYSASSPVRFTDDYGLWPGEKKVKKAAKKVAEAVTDTENIRKGFQVASAVGMGMCVSGVLSGPGCALVGFTYGFATAYDIIQRAADGANEGQIVASVGFGAAGAAFPSASWGEAIAGQIVEDGVDWVLSKGQAPESDDDTSESTCEGTPPPSWFPTKPSWNNY
jgi:RHS repeat-associated protein